MSTSSAAEPEAQFPAPADSHAPPSEEHSDLPDAQVPSETAGHEDDGGELEGYQPV